MRNNTVRFRAFAIVAVLAAFGAAVVGAQGSKPYAEGAAGQADSAISGPTEARTEGAEGSAGAGSLDAAGPTMRDTSTVEGQAGSAGRGRLAEWGEANPSAVSALSVLYRFSGVSDDGEQGSASRREATSVHCTNVSATTTEVEVQFFQWNGTDVYTGTVNMPTNRTFTFSTQNTTIYFDDVLLGGSPGTDAIFQGSGRVLASNSNVICTAQVLDPLNYPPEFVTTLELFKQ